MALTVITLRPSFTVQTGAPTNTVVGAASAHAAWSDNSDLSFMQFTARCRNDGEIVRVGFPTPAIPTGAKVLSVEFQHKVMTRPDGAPPVIGLHWFRCLVGLILIAGQILQPRRDPFTSLCPVDTGGLGGTYVWKDLGAKTADPTGAAWDPATNLASGNFHYDYGRGDDNGGNHRISEVAAKITFQAVSTVTTTGPTGSVATTRPVVSWTYTSPDSVPQQSYQVVVATAAMVLAGFRPFIDPPLQDSGEQLGEDLQWALTDDLPDGQYSAYVRATAKWSGPGTFPTNTSSTTWTRAVNTGGPIGGGTTLPPAAQPPDAVLSSAVFDPVNDRIALTMVPSTSSPVTAAYTVQVSRDNGVTWASPPSLTFITANGMTPITVYDYLAPISATSKYRVLGYSQSGGQFVAAQHVSSELSVLTYGRTWRLADPANSLNNCVVIPINGKDGKHDEITFPRISATFQRIGGTGDKPPIVVNGPTQGEAGVLTLLFTGDQRANWPAFKQAMQSGHTLLLKKAHAEQKWVRLAAGPNTQDPKLTYDVVPGNPSVIYWYRLVVPYSEVPAPSFY